MSVSRKLVNRLLLTKEEEIILATREIVPLPLNPKEMNPDALVKLCNFKSAVTTYENALTERKEKGD